MRIADNKAGSVIRQYELELGGLYPIGEAKAIVALVFNHALGWPAVDLALRRNEALSESELLKVYLPLKRLRTGEPVQYVIGEVAFRGLRLKVNKSVLIPRPETEELVELIRARNSTASPRSIIDFGTGSGCIALSMKRAFPTTRVVGTDISGSALAVAKENGVLNGLDVEWVLADVLDRGSHLIGAPVDIIVSNPPYVPQAEASTLTTNVREFEPASALFVPDSDPLLFYRSIAERSRELFAVGGQLWFEVHHRHGADVIPMLKSMGYARTEIARDLSGMDRFVYAER
ncbi:MAG: peptide chain release factor N(5)-glutamine methyltransferase [Flavobacteriales bacterium]|nr:peptide chain release factor N(5)-glutamine methyltransferase [Flavobacteriales bacterium]